ncbi:MAG: DNA polymerase III subunit beta [Anaerolineales bacterium]
MKISCSQDLLARGLNIVSRAAAPHSSLPVLGYILLHTDNGRLALSATNLQVAMTCWIDADVEEEGDIALHAPTLVGVVNTLPQDQVELKLDDSTLNATIKSKHTETTLSGIRSQDFPAFQKPTQEKRISLEARVLKQLIEQVAFAAAVDDSRPLLTGVLTNVDGAHIRMVAADGFRLSMRSAPISEGADQNLSKTIPAHSLMEVAGLINNDLEEVYLSFSEEPDMVSFELGDVLLQTILIDGSYPEFNSIVPTEYSTRTVLPAADFCEACKTVAVLARNSDNLALVRLVEDDEASPAYAVVAAESAELGHNEARIDASMEGSESEFGVNINHLIEALKVINTSQVALEITSPGAPIAVKPVGENDFVQVILPVHIGR